MTIFQLTEATASRIASGAAISTWVLAFFTGIAGLFAWWAGREEKRYGAIEKAKMIEAQKLHVQQIRSLDPRNRNITTANLMIQFEVSPEIVISQLFSPQVGAALGTATGVLLRGFTRQHHSTNYGKYIFSIDCAPDSLSMGKPVHSLASAEVLQVYLPTQLFPIDTEIFGGKIILRINSDIRLELPIAPQKVRNISNPHSGMIEVVDISKTVQEAVVPLQVVSNGQ